MDLAIGGIYDRECETFRYRCKRIPFLRREQIGKYTCAAENTNRDELKSMNGFHSVMKVLLRD